MSDHDKIQPQVEDVMKGIGKVIHECCPEGFGFALLMFKFGPGTAGEDNRMNYLSNAPRADMIAALKELIANFEGRTLPPNPVSRH